MKPRKATTVAALAAAALVSVLMLSTPAAASTLGSGYSCSPNGSASPRTCVAFSGDSTRGYRAIAVGTDYFGHVDLWGPGVSFRNSPTSSDPYTDQEGALGSGWLCAHGWAHLSNGSYLDMGMPCVWVP
ncbi:hypothetical protein SAMN04489731_1291 [Amycolatopsis regifaucium]|nr:hypothetical protein SAMN04489731_1291 [Amycolatopsis regifaucium]